MGNHDREVINYNRSTTLPKTEEKYTSFSKVIESLGKTPFTIRFLDSFKFMSSSLDKLTGTLSRKDFKNLCEHQGGDEII